MARIVQAKSVDPILQRIWETLLPILGGEAPSLTQVSSSRFLVADEGDGTINDNIKLNGPGWQVQVNISSWWNDRGFCYRLEALTVTRIEVCSSDKLEATMADLGTWADSVQRYLDVVRRAVGLPSVTLERQRMWSPYKDGWEIRINLHRFPCL